MEYSYKIETHLHTNIVSPCGKVSPEQIVARYHAAGYAGLIVTDHYALNTFPRVGIDVDQVEDILQEFLKGYQAVKYYADQVGIRTYYGAELRFTENNNDYLLYGFSEELMSDPKMVCQAGLAAFIEMARADGAVLIQAHPYRKGCVPVAPHLVDGVEAINRHDKHNNRNDMAMALADRYELRKTSGCDFHDDNDRCIAGIAAPYLPKDSREVAKLIRSGEYKLLGQQG